MDSNKAESKTDASNDNDVNDGDDGFKQYLVGEVARMIEEKKPLKLLWSKLQMETGRNCEELWNEMVHITTSKVMNLISANDLSQDVITAVQLSADDWLLFDMVLVHEKRNVTGNKKQLPQCLNELYKLVQEHKVEHLAGDDLAQAWIRLTLQYNTGGRQVSPMLLQLRWYQLKELSRQQVYRPAVSQDRDRTKLLHAVAIKYQKIVTEPLEKWQKLIKEKRVILPQHFVKILNSNDLWKPGKADTNWYLQVNNEAYDYFMRPDNKIGNDNEKHRTITINSNSEIDDVLRQKAKNIIEIDKFKDPSEVDSKNADFVKTTISKTLDKSEKTNKKVSERKNKDVDIEIDKILQEKVKIMSDSSEAIKTNEEKNVKRKENFGIEITELIDEDIEFLDAYKNKRQKIISEPACSTNKKDNGIDSKLLMKAIVFTRKLDSMKVFQQNEYNSVKDKKMIEDATIESKPIFKQVSKNKQVRKNNFPKQIILGQEMDSNQSKSDITQSYKIKSSSRLLQKPRKRSYNPMQLCNNPDFNNKLKKLTPAFLSSVRNKILLIECKPLTIDLDRQFEEKLVNGMCIFVDDPLKESTYNHPVKVEPIDAAEQTIKKNISSKVPENNYVTSDPSILKNTLSSSQCTSQTLSRRRKTITLQNIDEIRKFNQSLLTAEVTPIYNDAKQSSSDEAVTIEVKKEMLEDPDDKNMQDENFVLEANNLNKDSLSVWYKSN